MENILCDTTKFERLDADPVKLTLQREKEIWIWRNLNRSHRQRINNSIQPALALVSYTDSRKYTRTVFHLDQFYHVFIIILIRLPSSLFPF
jgi:hypothetical protein